MFDNAVDNRNAICFSNEEKAWKHINDAQLYETVEYLYEPSAEANK
jgi:hypothetical protein